VIAMPTTVLPDPPTADDPFYVGYDPPMPRPLARVVRCAVWLGVALGVSTVALVAARHRAIAGGVFEFGTVEPVAGVVVERPYPALRVPGRSALTLLVATGKHGAAPLIRGLTDRAVIVHGQRISREGNEMLEIATLAKKIAPDGSSEGSSGAGSEGSPEGSSGTGSGGASGAEVVLRGEIVDSKCFLGVMVPGQGKTHRGCASLCLRGGIPPALFVQDRAGESRLVLLVSTAGDALAPDVTADHAFEPTEMTGRLERVDGWWRLRTDPRRWRRLD
jgi:hypothetical protein